MKFRFLKRSAESLYLIVFKSNWTSHPHFSSHVHCLFIERFTTSNPRDLLKCRVSVCGRDHSSSVYKAIPSTVQNSWAFEYIPKLPNPDCPSDPPLSPTRTDTHRFHANRIP